MTSFGAFLAAGNVVHTQRCVCTRWDTRETGFIVAQFDALIAVLNVSQNTAGQCQVNIYIFQLMSSPLKQHTFSIHQIREHSNIIFNLEESGEVPVK